MSLSRQAKWILPALLLSFSLSSTAFAKTQAPKTEICKPTSETEIMGLFDRWNASLQTGDPHKVVENYAEKSVLLPTLSNEPRLNSKTKEEYFEHFLQKKPVGTIDSRMIEIDCNSAVDAGLYTFKFKDGVQVKARYTFTYKWDGKMKKWLITSHHSSVMPAAPERAANPQKPGN